MPHSKLYPNIIIAKTLTCVSHDVVKRTDKYVQNNGGHHHVNVFHVQ